MPSRRSSAVAGTYNAFAAHGILPPPSNKRTILELHSELFHAPTAARGGDGFTQVAEARSTVKALGNNRSVDERYLGVIECGEFPENASADMLKWNWSGDLLAVARRSGVGIWNVEARQWVTQGLRGAKEVLCVAWRPWGGRMLAVGCERGVALWVVGRGKMTWLERQGFGGINGMEWSPDGRWLVTVTREGPEVLLWDVGTRTANVVGKGGGCARFSPQNGRYLFGGGGEFKSFRIWDTSTWKMEKFGVWGTVKAAAWSGDASMIAVGCKNEEAVHILRVNPGKDEDLARTIYTETTGLPEVGTGGDALVMAWDSSGERLAVVYSHQSAEHEEEYLEGNLVALYATSLQPYLRLNPIGYIRGPSDSGRAVSLQFQPKTRAPMGAILAIAWAGGCISFVQLEYLPENRVQGFC